MELVARVGLCVSVAIHPVVAGGGWSRVLWLEVVAVCGLEVRGRLLCCVR